MSVFDEPLRCPDCGFETAVLDDWEIGGADEGCLICPRCSFHGHMEGMEPEPDCIVGEGT